MNDYELPQYQQDILKLMSKNEKVVIQMGRQSGKTNLHMMQMMQMMQMFDELYKKDKPPTEHFDDNLFTLEDTNES